MSIKSLPVRNILKKPVRTAALIFISAFLFFSVFAGTVIITSLQRGMDSLEARLGADIVVVPDEAKSKTDFENMLLQGTPGYFYMDKSYLDQIAARNGVEKVSAQYFLSSAKAGCCSMAVQIIGFDPETDFSIKPWIQKSYKKDLQHLDVVVGSNITAGVGEQIKLYDVICNVVARLDETGTGLDTAIYATADTVKSLIEGSEKQGMNVLARQSPDNVISSVYVSVKEGYDPEQVTNDINLHVRHVQAVKTKTMLTGISDSLSGISSAVKGLMIAIWIIALLVMIIAFTMLINERKKEFAVLRIIGMSRKQLASVILAESVLLSTAGGAIGIALASLVVFPFSSLIESRLNLPFLTPDIGQIIVLIIITIIAAAVIGPIASAYSAARLSRTDAGTILREGN